jgi:hypothetical protein
MGDSRDTLNGRENVCIIGISASEDRLKSIKTAISWNSEFLSVSDVKPLILASSGGTEPLVSDGVYTADGTGLDVWAKAAYDSLKKESSEKKGTGNNVTMHQPEHETPDQEEDAENRAPAEIKRHGCLTVWLLLSIAINAIIVLFFLLIDERTLEKYTGGSFDDGDVAVSVILGLTDIVAVILLLKWRKIGYWLFVVSTVAGVIINIASGLPVMNSLSGFIGLAVLSAVLSCKADDVTGWDNLK